MEKSSQNAQTANAAEEAKQTKNNSQDVIPAGVDNLERNIQDATSRYDDLDFENMPSKP